jgi:flagellar basal body-associated protein FliL
MKGKRTTVIAVILLVVLALGVTIGVILHQSKKVTTAQDQEQILKTLAGKLSATIPVSTVTDPDKSVVLQVRDVLSEGSSTSSLEELTSSLTVDDILNGHIYFYSAMTTPSADKTSLQKQLSSMTLKTLKEPTSADKNTLMAYLVAQERLSNLYYNMQVPYPADVLQFLSTATASSDVQTAASAVAVINAYNQVVDIYEKVLSGMAKPGDALSKVAQTANSTIANLTDTYPPSANTTELQTALQKEIVSDPSKSINVPWLFKAERQYVSTSLSTNSSVSDLQKIIVAAKFNADADLSKELSNTNVFTDLNYTDSSSSTVNVALNQSDIVSFAEKVKTDVQSFSDASKNTPLSSIAHDLSLNYMNDVQTLTSSSGYANAMNDLMVTLENARKWKTIVGWLNSL